MWLLYPIIKNMSGKEDTMILVKRYRLRRSGLRGHSITIPEAFVEQSGLKCGDSIAMYRDRDRLVLIPGSSNQKASS